MKHLSQHPLSYAVLIGINAIANQAIAADKKEIVDLGTTTVYTQETKPDEYVKLENETSSILSLTNKETPQSISSVTQAQMQDFELNTINEVMNTANGVKLEQIEPARSYIRARGFLVDQLLVDGIGVPSIYDNHYGDVDSAAYDSVEVIRGSNGMMNSVGNPSAAISLMRKLPTAKNEGKFKIKGDQHSGYRVDGDVSGKLNDSGSIRGRLVAAHQGGDSYIDRMESNKGVLYGAVAFDLSDNLELTLGHEFNKQDMTGVMWGALPLLDNNNNRVYYDPSANSAANWNETDNTKNNTFIKLQADLAGWNTHVSADKTKQKVNNEWVYNYRSGNKGKAFEITSYPSRYNYETDVTVVNAKSEREFDAFGKTHAFGIGAQWSKAETKDGSRFSSKALPLIANIKTWNGNTPKPTFDTAGGSSDVERKEKAVYFSSKINPVGNLNVLLGGRYAKFDFSGNSYTRFNWDNEYSKFSPSAGMTYDFDTTDTTVYVSYNDIFKSQTQTNKAGVALEPARGNTKEIGFKQNFNNGKALVSASLFDIKLDRLAEAAGERTDKTVFYKAGDELNSKGLEVDISGKLTDQISVNVGFSQARVKTKDDKRARTAFPVNTLKASVGYMPSAMPKLRLGANVLVEDPIEATIDNVTIEQDHVTVLNLFGEYSFNKNLALKINLDNVTDEAYLNGLYSAERYQVPQSFYAKPFTTSASLIYKY